jgi:glycosyltransferase 2 family protein
MSRAGSSVVLRAAVSLLLLGYVFWQVRWREVWDVTRGIDPTLLAVYVAAGALSTVLSAAKWHLLARGQGLRATLRECVILYLVGYLFNHVLPSSVGGDAVRAYALGRTSRRPDAAFASVFMERATGFATLAVIVALIAILDPRAMDHAMVAVPVALTVVGYLALLGVAVTRWAPAALRHHRAPVVAARLLKPVQGFQEAIRAYRAHPLAVAGAVAYSVLFYASTILTVYVGCLAFGIAPPLLALAAAVPVALAMAAFPVSLGGLGLQELAYVTALGLAGVPAPVALGLALLARMRALGFGLAGLLLSRLTGAGEALAHPLRAPLPRDRAVGP